jgi:hypothetical protein
MSGEPEQLKRGKQFQEAVQSEWAGGNAQERRRIEHTTPLLRGVTRTGRRRHGRMDIFVDELGDMVTVVEIKATDWDQILHHNRQKNVASHRRQVWNYIEKYVDGEQTDVCAGIIYPRAPRTDGLKEHIKGISTATEYMLPGATIERTG